MTVSDHAFGPHVTSETLSTYVKRALPTTDMAAVEEHLNRCESFRADAADVMALSQSRRRQRLLLAAVGVIAVVAAAVVFFLGRPEGGSGVTGEFQRTTPTQTADPASTPATVTESLPSALADSGQAIEVVTPTNGAVVRPDSLVFRWRTADQVGATVYQITISDDEGDVVWTSETTETQIALPRIVRLAPGKLYTWFVDGRFPGEKSAGTGVREFRTSP